MTLTRIFIVLLGLSLFLSCGKDDKSEIDTGPATVAISDSFDVGEREDLLALPPVKSGQLVRLSWLVGKWAVVSNNQGLTEEWIYNADSSGYSGQVYNFDGKRPVARENMKIDLLEQGAFYSASVIGQNNDEYIPFKIRVSGDNLMLASNPSHDFPTQIVYRYMQPDTIMALIEGMQDGIFRQDQIVMVREE